MDGRGCPQKPPAVNDTGNENFRKALGSKGDDAAKGGNSIMAYSHTIHEHFHTRGRVLPHLADSVVVTADPAPWTYGTPAVIGTPAEGPFDIHWLDIVLNNNAEYQFAVYVDGVLADEKTVTRAGFLSRSFPLPVQMPPVDAAQITVAIATDVGGGTANVKVSWHPY